MPSVVMAMSASMTMIDVCLMMAGGARGCDVERPV
jgi:hypothetical protein